METSVAPLDTGTHVEKVHTDSRPVHRGSRPLRIDVKAQMLSALNETRTRLGVSIESMAECAGVAKSAMSDALAGKRNFAAHWIALQGAEFEDAFLREWDKQTGREAKRARVARNLGELIRRVVEDLEDIA